MAALATSTITAPAHLAGAALIGAPATQDAPAGDVFAQLLAALGQPSADVNFATLSETVALKKTEISPGKRADHPANDPPGQTLRSLLTELHATENQPDNQGEIVSDAAKLLNKNPTASATPPADTPPHDADTNVPRKNVSDKDAKPANDANALVAQLLAAVQPAPSTPRPVQAPPADTKPSDTNLPVTAPDNILPASTLDVVATDVGRNATQAKPGRDTKRDDAAGKPDSVKTPSQSSTANALAMLSTAADHRFNQTPPAAPAMHSDAGSHAAPANNSDDPPNNPHPHASTPVSEAAPQATVASAAIPANLPPPTPGDSNALAAANSTSPHVQAASVPPAQFHASLQVGPAPAHALPDIGALAVTIAARSQDGVKHFDIRLDPPELGKVDVRLTMDDTGKAQASLVVEKPQTLELLQKDSSTLERALKDAGLDLSQNGLNFSLRGQQHHAGGENAPTPRARALHVRAALAIGQPAPALSSSGAAGEPRLDIRI